MFKRIFIISILIFYSMNAQENRLFWDGREWNSIRKQVKYVDEMEHKIKSTYINGVLEGRLYLSLIQI